MKKFVTLLFVLGAFGGAFYLIGMVLPRVHSATSRATFTVQPGAIYQVLVDIEHWDEWHPAIADLQRLPDRNGREVWGVTGKDHKRWELELGQTEDPIRFQAFFVRGKDRETFRAEMRWLGEGSIMRVTEQGDTPEPWRRALRMFRDAHEPLSDVLRALGNRLGEQVAPEEL